MAYLKHVRIGQRTYFYIIKSVRRGDKIVKKVLEYLGANPAPDRLRRALEYWQVRTKPNRIPGKAKGRSR